MQSMVALSVKQITETRKATLEAVADEAGSSGLLRSGHKHLDRDALHSPKSRLNFKQKFMLRTRILDTAVISMAQSARACRHTVSTVCKLIPGGCMQSSPFRIWGYMASHESSIVNVMVNGFVEPASSHGVCRAQLVNGRCGWPSRRSIYHANALRTNVSAQTVPK
jgi:hypothetical protein